jgi:hypothetical protein
MSVTGAVSPASLGLHIVPRPTLAPSMWIRVRVAGAGDGLSPGMPFSPADQEAHLDRRSRHAKPTMASTFDAAGGESWHSTRA